MGNKLLNNIRFGIWEGTQGTMANIPRALPLFPLPRPTAKKPLQSKQHKIGLCGGESQLTVAFKLMPVM